MKTTLSAAVLISILWGPLCLCTDPSGDGGQ